MGIIVIILIVSLLTGINIDKETKTDQILLMAFVCTIFMGLGAGIIYKNYVDYPYYDETLIPLKQVELKEIKKDKYLFYEEDDKCYYYREIENTEVQNADNVKILYGNYKRPYMSICIVKREYKVTEYWFYNWLVSFNFEDYSNVLDEVLYVFYVPSVESVIW